MNTVTMDENVKKILQVYQKHELLKNNELCCSDENPCDMVILFNEIRRLNGQIATLHKVLLR